MHLVALGSIRIRSEIRDPYITLEIYMNTVWRLHKPTTKISKYLPSLSMKLKYWSYWIGIAVNRSSTAE